MFTKPFWSDLLERAVRAAAWSALALFGADQSGVIHHIDLAALGTVAAYAAVASVLASLAGSQVGAKDSGSFLPADVDPPQPADAPAGSRRPKAGENGFGVVGLVVAFLVFLVLLAVLGLLR